MAKITITIEDLPGNRVAIKTDPTMEQMIHIELSGNSLTSAHGYAFKMLNTAREESRKQTPLKFLIPRVKSR